MKHLGRAIGTCGIWGSFVFLMNSYIEKTAVVSTDIFGVGFIALTVSTILIWRSA